MIDEYYPVRSISPGPLLPAQDIATLQAEGYPVFDTVPAPKVIDLIDPVRWDAVLNVGQRNKLQGQLDSRGITTDISAASTLGQAINAILIDWQPLSGGLTNFDPAWFAK